MHHTRTSRASTLPDYDLHIPAEAWRVMITGLVCGIAGAALILARVEFQWLAYILLAVAAVAGLIAALLRQIITLRGRLRTRDLIVRSRAWRGDEQVLDVGCGNGILTMAVARQLKTGHVTGIDIWDTTAGQQTAAVFWNNAQAEGVRDRVSVRETDARHMPFEDGSFDVVVSSLALHHMGGIEDSIQAVQEITRVLKPGGTFLVYDMFVFTNAAVQVLRARGFRVKRLNGLVIRTIQAEKPMG